MQSITISVASCLFNSTWSARAVVRTDLALASAEARQTLTLLLADRLVVLPVHVSTAVAAVPARVRIAPAHHVRVLPV